MATMNALQLDLLHVQLVPTDWQITEQSIISLQLTFGHTHLLESPNQYGEPSINIWCNKHHVKQDSCTYFVNYIIILYSRSVNFKRVKDIKIQKASEISSYWSRSQKWSSNQDPVVKKMLTGHHQFGKWRTHTWSTYHARKMEELKKKLHDGGILMKDETMAAVPNDW